MCLKASSIQNAQIEKFVEHGMPTKVIKAVQYTLKKCAKEASDKESSSASSSSSDYEDNFIAIADTPFSLKVNYPITTTTKATGATTAATGATTTTATTTTSTDEAAASTTASTAAATTTTATTLTPASTATLATLATPATTTTTATTTEYLTVAERAKALKIPKLCGRFRQLQQQQQQQSNNVARIGGSSDQHAENSEKVYVDALAIGTQLTKQFAQRLNSVMESLQSTKVFTLLTKTTQPAHAIAICILAFVLLTVWPDLVDHNKIETTRKSSGSHHLAAVAYLGAFAIHFGAQIWMTFVSGLSLYFSLPRHTFGQCQQILFPKYFALNAMLSISMLILFVKYFISSWQSLAGCVQLGALIVSAVIEVTVRLYLAPPMLRLMYEKYKIEGAIGSGQEVGTIDQGVLVQCPHYQRIHKSFRRIHMTVAMGNMIVLIATCLHLYFLASKIQIC